MTDQRRRQALFALLALGGVGLWWGWREFWFLTDDAFITFRYVANRQLGLGYVWNPPPFQPVEGYSNFLWLLALDAVWTLARVEPPDAANVLSLGCAAVTLWRVWAWSAASPLAPVWRTASALLLLLSNRTFLTWSSSGLETASFNLLMLPAFTLVNQPRPPVVAVVRAALAPRALNCSLALSAARAASAGSTRPVRGRASPAPRPARLAADHSDAA